MSTTRDATRDAYTCGHCGGSHSPADTYEGSYCSPKCYYRERGEHVINQLESVSHYCNTCYGQVRDVEPIPDDVYEDADGYQYQTSNTTIAIDDFSREEYVRLEGTRWACVCGAVNPDATTAEIQNMLLDTVIANFYTALVALHRRGAIPQRPNRDRYFAALREEWRDARYAAGKAVYG